MRFFLKVIHVNILIFQNIGKVFDEEYGKYVFWNFEKNPSIQYNMTSAGKDAKYDDCGQLLHCLYGIIIFHDISPTRNFDFRQ